MAYLLFIADARRTAVRIDWSGGRDMQLFPNS
jgi:hypothetical protein